MKIVAIVITLIALIILCILCYKSRHTNIFDIIPLKRNEIVKTEIKYIIRQKIDSMAYKSQYPFYEKKQVSLVVDEQSLQDSIYYNANIKKDTKRSMFNIRSIIVINDSISINLAPKGWSLCRINGIQYEIDSNIYNVLQKIVTSNTKHVPFL
jgi:hypothetical protein